MTPQPDEIRLPTQRELELRTVANCLHEAAALLDLAARAARKLPNDDIRSRLAALTAPVARDLRRWADDYAPPEETRR